MRQRWLGCFLSSALLVLTVGCDDDTPGTGGDSGGASSSTDGGGSSSSPDDGGSSASGDYCNNGGDETYGSGMTSTPASGSVPTFTTTLEGCSLSEAEAAVCYGQAHTSSVSVSDGVRTITGNQIPNHDVDYFPNTGNPNGITAQSKSYTVTTSPVRTGTATAVEIPGVGLNGIKFEPKTAETFNETEWRYEALTFNGRTSDDPVNMGTSLGFDCNFAHVQPTGEYHYHGSPTALLPSSPAITHVGWASDGYPILGRWGYETAGDTSSSLVEMTGSYQVISGARVALGSETPPSGEYDGTFVQDWEYVAGLGTLDECNGRAESITVDGETFDYAYYVTHTYPYLPRCVWGTPDSSFGAGGGGSGGGMSGGGMMGPPPGGG